MDGQNGVDVKAISSLYIQIKPPAAAPALVIVQVQQNITYTVLSFTKI